LASKATKKAQPVDRLMDYPVDVDAGDLFRHAPPEVAAKWRAMAAGCIAGAGFGLSAQELLARQIADMGMSFRMTGDVEERAGRSPPCR
jgi:hypothetical protein